MSQLEMCPLYQSTPKVAHVSAMAIKCDSENKKTKLMASGNILSARQMDCGMLENAPLQPDRQKLCFVCSGLTTAQVRHVREFAKEYDADYVNQFKPDVTHVIVNTTGKENVTKSTLKYLQGIAHRKWIISYKWIEDCHRERKLLDEVSYEATTQYDSFYETGPRNSRLREKGLFEGFTFLCIEPYINVTLSQYQVGFQLLNVFLFFHGEETSRVPSVARTQLRVTLINVINFYLKWEGGIYLTAIKPIHYPTRPEDFYSRFLHAKLAPSWIRARFVV